MVYSSGLENRQAERLREFESLLLRHEIILPQGLTFLSVICYNVACTRDVVLTLL